MTTAPEAKLLLPSEAANLAVIVGQVAALVRPNLNSRAARRRVREATEIWFEWLREVAVEDRDSSAADILNQLVIEATSAGKGGCDGIRRHFADLVYRAYIGRS